MQQGMIVEQGTTEHILSAPPHPYTRRLLDALPRRGPAQPVAPAGTPLIELRDLVIDYPGRKRLFAGETAAKRAVDGVSLSLQPGETLALVGQSGSGKTTLGRALVGLVTPSGGEVLFRGRSMRGVSAAERRAMRRQCQFIFQDPYSSLDPRMRVGEVLGEPLRNLPDLGAGERRARVEAVLDDVGLPRDFLRRFPHELSGGQRQRVAIGRAIIGRPALVIADEPVSALDMTVQKQILELFGSLRRQYGFACLFISHDLGAVEQVADRVAVMQDGRIVELATRDALFDDPQHAYTRQLLAATPSLDRLEELESPAPPPAASLPDRAVAG
jgi:peptide/nickel transport system ATP-binding protein